MELSKLLRNSCDVATFLAESNGDGENNLMLLMKRCADSFFTDLHIGKTKKGAMDNLALTLENLTLSESFLGEIAKRREYLLALYDRLWDYLKGNMSCSYDLKRPVVVESRLSGDGMLSVLVNLIVKEKDGTVIGYLFHPYGKCKRSARGRSLITQSQGDPELILAKLGLEKEYPGIILRSLYLANDDDTLSCLSNFQDSGNKGCNVITCDYASFYSSKGSFDEERLEAYFEESMEAHLEQAKMVHCPEVCPNFNLCMGLKSNSGPIPISDIAVKDTGESANTAYTLPPLSKEQQLVVSHVSGPCICYAAPGSGKTLCLVSRARHLISEVGIPAPFVLLCTFTKEAVNEITNRLSCLLPPTELPVVSTINALCYHILLDNKEIVGHIKLLVPEEQFRIIKNLLSVYPNLDGFNYDVKGGTYGLYQTLSNRLAEWKTAPDVFFERYPSVNIKMFTEFAESYYGILASANYIDFDDQITLCNKLFREHPKIRQIYQSIYQYVMVDEFQDINEEQYTFLEFLTQNHHNLMVVGDDDQGIYGWRGAVSQYMIDFPKKHPGCVTVIMKDNYRSTQEIVSCASSFIAQNEERVQKEIVAASGRTGVSPTVIKGGADIIDKTVRDLLEEGISPKDITVISSRNKPLEELDRILPCKTLLNKSFLRRDCFTEFIRVLLHLAKGEEGYFSRAALLFGVRTKLTLEEAAKQEDETMKKLSAHIAWCLAKVNQAKDPMSFIESLKHLCNWSNAPEVLMDKLTLNQINSFEDCIALLDGFLEFEDTTKVIPTRTDSILLITAHESKGAEYPVVILLNDFKEDTPETRRAFYVALTRAKERVYVIEDDKSIPFLQGLADVV